MRHAKRHAPAALLASLFLPIAAGFTAPGCSAIIESEKPTCGDGVREGDEDCDLQDLGGLDCRAFPCDRPDGTLRCNANCRFDFGMCGICLLNCGNGVCDPDEDPTTCMDDCHVGPNCGNNQVDAGEQCDGTPAQNCFDLGFAGGTLGCINCLFDYVNCVRHTIGGPCRTHVNCEAAECIPDTQVPGGYCTQQCDADAVDCICHDFRCHKPCSIDGPSGCRSGYQCQTFSPGRHGCWHPDM